MHIPPELTATPLFGLALTVVSYAIAQLLAPKLPIIIQFHITLAFIVLVIFLGHVPVEDYQIGGKIVSLFLGPATVALAIPVYKHQATIKRLALPIGASVCVGSLISIASSLALAFLFHASRDTKLSILTRSITTPISIEVTKALHGLPDLAAVITVLSGLVGALLVPSLFRLFHLRGDLPTGLALGVSSHGIGTATALRTSELQGTYAGLAMAINGILTAALLTPLAPQIQKWL